MSVSCLEFDALHMELDVVETIYHASDVQGWLFFTLGVKETVKK